MTEFFRVLAAVGGVVLIIGMLSDAVATLIVTQGSSGLWRPTRIFYAVTWRVTRRVAARMGDRAGEYTLNVYPALSLLGLLVLWLAGLMVGWSLVYWGLDQQIGGTRDFGTLVYYAGTSLVTPVFGSAHGGLVRLLTLLETLTGVVTIALMISYLPALYGSYSRRESRLLTLDDPLGGRITPTRVVELNAPGGDVEMLYRSLAEWQMWTADVLESHVSYPMLALFRSQHVGQSWVTALGVVTDAATLTSACVEGALEPGALLPLPPGAAGDRRDLEPAARAPFSRAGLVAHRGELRARLGPPGRDGPPAARQGRGLGGPAGAAGHLRRPARASDRLPRRAARVLGPLRRGDGGRRGGAGGQRGQDARRLELSGTTPRTRRYSPELT